MKTTNKNNAKKFKGISLLVLIITVIIMIIIASAIILMVLDKDTIDIAKETALRTDMRTMLDNYDQRYRELLYEYQGDETKIKDSDFDGIVPDDYLNTGDYVAEKDGIRYQGDDEETKEIAIDMGLLVGKQGILTGIDSVTVSDETTTTARAEVKLTGNPTGDFNFDYYVYDGTRWILLGSSISENIYTLKNLKYNYDYKLKVEVSDSQNNTFTSDEVIFKTQDLLLGRVILRLNDKNGSDYVPGEWTNQNVYIEAVQTDQDTETSYIVRGANLINNKMQTGSVLQLQGESTATVITSDGYNEKTSEALILIDKEGPQGKLELETTTERIVAKVLNPIDSLSGIKEFRFYIDGIIQSTQKEPTYTFNKDIIQSTDYNIKVVMVDIAGNETTLESGVTTETVPGAESVVIEASPTTWTNGDVNVKVKYEGIDGFKLQYSRNGLDWETIGQVGASGEYNTTVTENTTIYVRYIDGIGQTGVSKSLTIANIDKELPVIDTLASSNPNPVNTDIVLTAKATDSLSGIIAYQFSTNSNIVASSSGWNEITRTTSQITQNYTVTTNNTYYFYVKDAAGNINKSSIVVNNIDKEAPKITNIYTGTSLYMDQTFTSGLNGTSIYNNAANGTVTNNRVASSSDNPTGSPYMLEVKISGTASPGLGGFYQATSSRAGATFVHRIVAKIPVGYTIQSQSNAIGDGGTRTWITPTAGTGEFEEYICVIKCGTTGSFSTFGHINLEGPAATASNPVTWYVALADLIDTGINGPENSIIFTATDNVGVKNYGINQSSSSEPSYVGINRTETIMGGGKIDITANGTFYIWVKDAAGNIGKSSVNVDKIIKEITVNFDAQGGSVSQSSKAVQIGGTYGTLPTPTRTGYSFGGWYTGTNGSGTNITSSTTVTSTSNQTLYAKWIINNYYLDLNTYLDGASYGGSRVKVNLTVGGSNKGYVSDYFTTHPYGTSWSINGLQIDGVNLSYTASGSVGATDTIIPIYFYTLTITINNSSYGTTSASSMIVKDGTSYWTNGSTLTLGDSRTVTASPTAATGYTTTFSSWSPSSAMIEGGPRTVTANFSRSANSYTATFNGNGGSNGSSITRTYGSQLGTLPTSSRTGYTFQGWYTAASGGSQISSTTTMPAGNVTYYAHWVGNTYYVAYNGNGATGGSTATSTHTYGTARALTANGFTKGYKMGYGSKTLSYTFKNWNTNSSGTGTSYSNGQSVTNLATSGTVTLYAQWTLSKTGIVTATGNSLNMRTGPGSGYANIGTDGYNRYAKTNATATITNCAYENYGSSGTLWVYVTVPCVRTVNGTDYDDGTKSGWVSSDYINLN